jgi:photosystem II stability/assembly factor-like uncharacterized protein
MLRHLRLGVFVLFASMLLGRPAVAQTTLLGVFFTDANTGTIVGGGGTIARTTNGGATWSAQFSGTTQTLQSVFFTDANTGTAVGGEYGEVPDSTILRTTDGGQTWTRQYVNMYECVPCSFAPLFSVFFTDANTGTVVGELSTIMRTTDGGQTWIPILLKNPHDFLLFLGLGRWRMSHSL